MSTTLKIKATKEKVVISVKPVQAKKKKNTRRE